MSDERRGRSGGLDPLLPSTQAACTDLPGITLRVTVAERTRAEVEDEQSLNLMED